MFKFTLNSIVCTLYTSQITVLMNVKIQEMLVLNIYLIPSSSRCSFECLRQGVQGHMQIFFTRRCFKCDFSKRF